MTVSICTAMMVVFYVLGRFDAHQTIATECQRLGAFYVGAKTFECKERK